MNIHFNYEYRFKFLVTFSTKFAKSFNALSIILQTERKNKELPKAK